MALLEDISASDACLQLEAPIPLDVLVESSAVTEKVAGLESYKTDLSSQPTTGAVGTGTVKGAVLGIPTRPQGVRKGLLGLAQRNPARLREPKPCAIKRSDHSLSIFRFCLARSLPQRSSSRPVADVTFFTLKLGSGASANNNGIARDRWLIETTLL